MKNIVPVLAIALLTGCAGRIEWKKGVSFKQDLPPTEWKVVRVEVSSIGLSVGQNQATQTPEAVIGYKRATYTSVPTGTNVVYAAPVRATIGVDGGFKVGVAESLETGTATDK